MDALKTLLRLTGVELLKFRGKSVTWVTLILLFVFPAGVEVFLVLWASPEKAIFPGVSYLLFAGAVFLLVALTATVVSVMALGNDYELGTVRVFLSQGVTRYQFILSKVLASVISALVHGSAYVCGTLLATVVAHVVLSDVPLAEAAGAYLLWRALGAVGVVGLVGFVFAGVVMLALVVGRNAWVGMLAGMGAFLADFFFGGLGLTDIGVYRHTISYYALSLLERCFESYTGLDMSGAMAEHVLAEPGRALAALLTYGCGLTLAAILIFYQQDLMVTT